MPHHKTCLPIFITFPGHRRPLYIKEEFYKLVGNLNFNVQLLVSNLNSHSYSLFFVTAFPNIIGAVDCTHIKIKRPSGEHEGDYVNRKSFHSINVQVRVICGYDLHKLILCI